MKTTLYSTLLAGSFAFAQNSAPSDHMNFGKHQTSDIHHIQVRVPSEGLAFSTYYESLGFWGNKGNSTGNGYGGIQKSTDSRGDEIHIFSIWHAIDNPQDTTNFPFAEFLGHGTTWEYFGGEGVGLKTWNFELGWAPDVWYSHVVRVWHADNNSYYGFFVRDGVTDIWRHLSTIGVKEPKILIQGKNDSFIEDWSSTGQNKRESHLKNHWARSSTLEWTTSNTGDYSVNDWDLDQGKRSYNYRNNWDAGVRSDSEGQYYFMTSGGNSTQPTSPLSYPNNTGHTFSNTDSGENKPVYTKLKIEAFHFDKQSSVLTWAIDSTRLPQFSFEVVAKDMKSNEVLFQIASASPQDRSFKLSEQDKEKLEGKDYFLKLVLIDLFDNETQQELTVKVGEAPTKQISILPNSKVRFEQGELIFSEKENWLILNSKGELLHSFYGNRTPWSHSVQGLVFQKIDL